MRGALVAAIPFALTLLGAGSGNLGSEFQFEAQDYRGILGLNGGLVLPVLPGYGLFMVGEERASQVTFSTKGADGNWTTVPSQNTVVRGSVRGLAESEVVALLTAEGILGSVTTRQGYIDLWTVPDQGLQVVGFTGHARLAIAHAVVPLDTHSI